MTRTQISWISKMMLSYNGSSLTVWERKPEISMLAMGKLPIKYG